MSLRQALLLLLGVTILATGCSDDRAESGATVDSTAATSTSVVSAPTIDETSEEGIRRAYVTYLDQVSNYLVATEPDAVEVLAKQSILDKLERQRQSNIDLVENQDLEGAVQMFIWENIEEIVATPGGVEIWDCAEVAEINHIGQTTHRFVDQVVGLTTTTDDSWIVDSVDVVHDGRLSPRHTCIPSSLEQRAEMAARRYLEAVQEARRDPTSAAQAAELVALLGDDLGSSWATALEGQAARGVAVVSTEDHHVQVLGIDTQYVGLVAVVAICVNFPDGVVLEALPESEPESLESPYAPGDSLSTELRIDLDTDDDLVVAMVNNGDWCREVPDS